MNRKLVVKSVVLVLAFIFMQYSGHSSYLSFMYENLSGTSYLQVFVKMLVYYSPVLLVSGLLFRKGLLAVLGLKHSLLKSFGLALAFTAPLFLIFPFFFQLDNELSGLSVFRGAFLAAVFEELVFRGLVFGVLFRLCGWKFLPAVMLTAVVFGLAHLYQAADVVGALLTFAVTFAGAVWFAWLYVKWDYNLFLPIFLHFLMNFSWQLFEVEAGAAGGTVTNIGRTFTILISIFVTVRYSGVGEKFSWKNFRISAAGSKVVIP